MVEGKIPFFREYETVYILKSDTPDDSQKKIEERALDTIIKHKGAILKVENWGKRKLAFEVQGNSKGVYVYILYLGDTNTVAEIETIFKHTENVIRFLTVKIADKVDLVKRVKDFELKKESLPAPILVEEKADEEIEEGDKFAEVEESEILER